MNRSIAILADPRHETGMMLKEIARSLSPVAPFISDNALQIIRRVENFSCDMIIVDDSAKTVAAFFLREMIRHPICTITPLLTLVAENNKTAQPILSSLCRPMVVPKPLSPGRLANGYKNLMKVWSSGFFLQIAEAVQAFSEEKKDLAMQILTKLTRDPKSQPVVAPCVANVLRQSGNGKVAEKILLAALKIMPRDVGVALSLSDLYLSNGVPTMSQRLIKNIDNNFQPSLFTSYDKLQAALMLNDLSSCINVVRDLHGRGLAKDFHRDLLLRFLYSEGRMKEFEELIPSDQLSNRYLSMWNPPATTTAPPLAG